MRRNRSSMDPNIRIGYKIINCLDNKRYTKISEIRYKLKKNYGIDMRDIEIREIIQFLRMNFLKFQNPTGKYYLIANMNGYIITDKREVLVKYLHTIQYRIEKLEAQAQELKKVVNNGEERGNNEKK